MYAFGCFTLLLKPVNNILSKHERRLFLLNVQIAHMDVISMSHIAKWLTNHLVRAVTRQEEAKERIEACGVSMALLRSSWKEQVTAQAKPLPGMPLLPCARFIQHTTNVI